MDIDKDSAFRENVKTLKYSFNGFNKKYKNYVPSKETIKWLKNLAQSNDASAQYYLGYLYSEGFCTTKPDFKKAFELLTLSSNQGNMYAKNNLGVIYEDYHESYNVKQDYKKAVELYTLASDQGHMNAQMNLGKLYKNGLGVKQDYKKSMELFMLAGSQGNVNAQQNIDNLKRRIKKIIPKTISISMKEYLDRTDKINALERENFELKVVPKLDKHLIPVLINIVTQYL